MTLDAFLRQFGGGLSDELSIIGLGIVFLAGVVASAVCPCTVHVGLGVAGAAGATETESKRGGLAIAAAFFTGIVVNLTVLGMLAGRLGAFATAQFGRYWSLGMALMFFAGAVFVFLAPRLKVSQLAGWRRPGVTGAFGYGFVFSLGTSVAPLLLLLSVSAAAASPMQGLVLAFVFGLGRGLPFLLAGLAAGALTGFTRLSAWSRPLHVISGLALLGVSLYYANTFAILL